jgi:acetate kinase
MNVLVLNCGSSSVKFQLIATDLERIDQDAFLQIDALGHRREIRRRATPGSF